MKKKICSDCGVTFNCGADEEHKNCWCNDYPPIMPLDFTKNCRCPDCLKKVIMEKIQVFVASITPENAKNCLPKNYSDNGKLIEGIDYNIQDHKWVFTKWYHLKRGYCCKNGCIHCPYELNEKA